MGIFHSFEPQKRRLFTASSSSFAPSVHRFEPVSSSSLQPAPFDREPSLEHAHRFGHSLDCISILSPEQRLVIPSHKGRSIHLVQQKSSVQEGLRSSTESISPEGGFQENRPHLKWDFAHLSLSPSKETTTRGIQQAAQTGIHTPSSALPYKARLQQAFGHYQLSSIQAHMGRVAQENATAMQAKAYATGDHVVFAEKPDLRTVAHEVTHVIQQRLGLWPRGGIGREGDIYEQQAEAVADRVAAGGSAMELLDEAVKVTGERKGMAQAEYVVQRIKLGIKGVDGEELDTQDLLSIRNYLIHAVQMEQERAIHLLLIRIRDKDSHVYKEVEGIYQDLKITQKYHQVTGKAQPQRIEIPPLVHFFWVGNSISKAAVENILSWVESAKNTNWKIWLWSDPATQWNAEEKQTLSTNQVEFKNIYDVLDQRLKNIYDKSTLGVSKAYNMASDLARYSILKKYGGVYADVDIQPGKVDLSASPPKMSKEDIPFLGPLIRDKKTEQEVTKNKTEFQGHREAQLAYVASKMYAEGQYGNQLLIAQQDSEFLEKIIAHLPTNLGSMGEDDWSVAAPMRTGPYVINKLMHLYLEEKFGVSSEGMDIANDFFDPETFINWSQLQWLTKESESQVYDKQGTEEKKKSIFSHIFSIFK